MANIPSVTPLKKSDFPHLIAIKSLLLRGEGWDFTATSPPPCWDMSGSRLRRPYARCLSLMSSMYHAPCCVPRTVLSWSHLLPLVLIVFLPPVQHRSLRPEGRGVIQTSNIGLSMPQSLLLCMLAAVGFVATYHLL